MDEIAKKVLAHAAEVAPNECCGLVVVRDGVKEYVRCINESTSGSDRFVISAEAYAEAEDQGEILMVAHSHPYIPPTPSEADRVGVEISGIPWLIVNYPNGDYTVTEPCGFKAPLIGRTFCKGTLDCYALVQDYYAEARNIKLPDYVRPEVWFEIGHSILLENFEGFGFKEIDAEDMEPGDCILMQVGATVPNHCAVYIGDNLILHHVLDRLSSRDVYGSFWRKVSVKYLRYVG